MDFVWISLKTTYDDGRIDTEIWRASGDPPLDMSRLVTMTFPVKNGNPHIARNSRSPSASTGPWRPPAAASLCSAV